MKTALVIPIYNRPDYVRRCFDSLRKLTVKPDLLITIDDGSTDKEIPALIFEFSTKTAKGIADIIYLKHDKNIGVKGALITVIDKAFSEGCDLVINLDSDAVVKPDFIERMISMRSLCDVDNNNYIISGFNNPKEPVIKDFGDFVTKRHGNGINMCYDKKQYDRYIKPALLKEGNWDFNTSALFAVTIPSVVQHIGLQSSMGHVGADVAQDFKMLSLPSVTLFGIDSHDKEGIMRAAEISCRDIEYGAVKVITEDLFTKGGNTDQRRRDYSRFMLKDLAKEFTTAHVLTIHADGYVLNWEAWDDSWLQYDYIGATWLYKDNMNVGNGGFSLRSKKLCDILAEQDIDEQLMHPEDHCICRTYRESLEKEFGVKFAPEEVANRFSIEGYGAHVLPGGNKYTGQFGFHSSHVDFTNTSVPPELRYTPRPVLQARQPFRQPHQVRRR